MKDIYKNPALYYILVPIVIALWPLVIGGIYLPAAERSLKDELSNLERARTKVAEILTLDRDRLGFADPETGTTEFAYHTAVHQAASLCKISATNCQLSAKPIMTSKGQKSQSCHVILKEVDIATFAKFLSAIQLRWASLQCVNVTLAKKKGLPDKWKVTLDFKYYY